LCGLTRSGPSCSPKAGSIPGGGPSIGPGVLHYAGGDCVGCGYIGSSGHIGPLAVLRADLLRDAFATALRLAALRSAEKISRHAYHLPDAVDGIARLRGLDSVSAAQTGLPVIRKMWAAMPPLREWYSIAPAACRRGIP
jgi:hypothetical protein